MGIKGWLAIGAGLIATVVIVVKRRKKEDETYDRIQHMIHNVDLEGTEEETTEKIIDDIEKSLNEMDLDDEEELAEEKINQAEDNAQKVEEQVQKMNEDPEHAKKMAEKAEAEYKRKVKKAVEQKNWYKLEELFDGKYAGGPWHPSPASVFSEACSHGDISEEFLKMAKDHYGKMWCYSGD